MAKKKHILMKSKRQSSWIRNRSFVLILLGFSFCAASQQDMHLKYTLGGRVMDFVSHKPVIYATINIADKAGNAVASVYTGENGFFKARLSQAGTYKIEITSVGYNTKEITVSINEEKGSSQIDTFYLSTTTGDLAAVTVTSKKKLIEQRPGMLVYNAENDLSNKGGTAADVLRKAPVLNVDAQGNITMRGSGNLKILINGKYSGQMARSPADALNMMPASNIKSIEIITTPSARYDAEGAAGVINIITKKDGKNISGSLEAVASNWEQAFNPRVSMTQNKWSINFNGHLHRYGQKSTSSLERFALENNQPTLTLNQESSKKNTAPHGSGDLNIVYQPDSVSEFSLGINAWFGKWPENYKLSSVVSVPGAGNITEQYDQQVASKHNYLGSDINVGYSRKLKKPGRGITLLLQGSPSSDHSKYDAVQTNKDLELLYRELNNSKTNNHEWTLQADYIHPLTVNGKYIWEAGLKMIRRKVANKYDIAASNAQQPDMLEPQPSRSDLFMYKQDVIAAYSMLKINFKKNWYAEAGARIEQTFIDGAFNSNAMDFSNRFTNFVPTATVSKKISDDQTLSLSYTKRLTRPYIWDLNPNANVSDPKNIVTGNPQLQPETAHQAELIYGLTQGSALFLNASFFWKQTDNAMIDFTNSDANGVAITSKQNLAANKQYGLNLSSTASLSSRWTMNGNVNINHFDFNSRALTIFNRGWAAEINLNTTYKLPHHYAVQIFGEYNSRTVTLQGYKTFRYYYSFAGKKEFTASKIIITISAVNPFSKFIQQTDAYQMAGFISRMDNRYFNRAVKLALTWEFGRMFEQKERKKIINDDVKDQGKG